VSKHQDSEVDKVAEAIQNLVASARRASTLVRPTRSASMIAKFYPASGMSEAEIAERITMAAIHSLVRVEL
jgi:hypothetical protein